MIKSIVDLAESIGRLATAPVEMAIDGVNAVLEPAAREAQELVDDVKEALEEE